MTRNGIVLFKGLGFDAMRTLILRLMCGLLACLLIAGNSAWAAAEDIEPNNSCATAQPLGSLADGTINGSLTQGDVDFFTVTGLDPALSLDITLTGESGSTGTEALGDPYLGVFSSSCVLLGSNDDYDGLNSRLQIQPPTDGVLILAATSCCDVEFLGSGSSGSYRLQISEYVPPPSISGIVLDGEGNLVNWGYVSLVRCDTPDLAICSGDASGSSVDYNGSFSIDPYNLEIGATYQFIFSDYNGQYPTKFFTPFTLTALDTYVELRLDRFAISTEIVDVPDVVAAGSTSEISVRLTNNTDQPLSVDTRLLVNAYSTGSVLGYSRFQTAKSHDPTPIRTTLLPGVPTLVVLEFDVSADALPGTHGDFFLATSAADQPMTMYVNQYFAYYEVVANGQTSLVTGAALRQRIRFQEELRMRRLTSGRPDQPELNDSRLH